MPLLVVKQHSSIWSRVNSYLAVRNSTVRNSIDTEQNKVFKVYRIELTESYGGGDNGEGLCATGNFHPSFNVLISSTAPSAPHSSAFSTSHHSCSYRSTMCLGWTLLVPTSTISSSWRSSGLHDLLTSQAYAPIGNGLFSVIMRQWLSAGATTLFD